MGVLGLVGGFRRTVKAPVNPMDKSTIFSIYPKKLVERHHTIQPGVFVVEAGSYEKPSCLVVGSSSWWKDIDDHQPILEIPNGSVLVADAVVKNYCSGILACDMSNNMPGLFWYPGTWNPTHLLKPDLMNEENAKLYKLYQEAKRKQDNWFKTLINLADGLWARTNGNPLTISDDMRLAAREMGVLGKDWMTNHSMVDNIKCVACGMPRNPHFPICSHCHTVIDKALYDKLNLSGVVEEVTSAVNS